jgi:16S rRNA (cytidine1402-2'-O)-methyltransferase
LIASFASALVAARDAAAQQHYPQGALYVVATPIGNLADISLRALHVLQLADAVACEDTRHTQSLLRAYGIERGGAQLLAVHQHNEAEAAQAGGAAPAAGPAHCLRQRRWHARRQRPRRAAGSRRARGRLRVVPLPGASSVTAALSAAGSVAHDGGSGFVFAGFLPGKAGERDAAVQALASEPRTVVLLEAPHRMEALARALAVLGARPVTVAREITKQFEDIATLACDGLAAWLAADANRTRGEFVVVVHGAPVAADAGDDQRVLRLLLAELPLKTAVKLAAEITGRPKNTLYDAALALRKAGRDDQES